MPANDPPNPRRPAPPGTSRPVVHRRSTPPPPIVKYEDVVASCGHPEKFGHFEDRLDRFRNDRRKKVTDRPCKACREKKRQEEEAALLARKEEKRQQAEARAQQPKQTVQRERLPDGAKFEVVYDAGAGKWSGTLTIGAEVFRDSASAVFKLLNKLDQRYRDSLAPEDKKTE